jgi:general secretion pathway protein G
MLQGNGGDRRGEAKERRFKPVLLGMLLSIVLAVLLAAVGLWVFAREARQGQRHRAELDLRNLQSDLDRYREKYGRYPSGEEGFQALVGARFYSEAPRDPWGREYLYRLEGDVPLVTTYGADGAAGGADADADISLRGGALK